MHAQILVTVTQSVTNVPQTNNAQDMIIIWLPNHGYQFPTSKSIWKPNFAQIGGFLYFGGHFGFKMTTIANQRWISIRNIIFYFEITFLPNRRIFVFGGHFVSWLPWQRPPFWIFSTPKKCHILRWISYKVSWSLIKGIKNVF